MSKHDKLKERLTIFVNENNNQSFINIPIRITIGHKLDVVCHILNELLTFKYKKQTSVSKYENKDDGYVFYFN